MKFPVKVRDIQKTEKKKKKKKFQSRLVFLVMKIRKNMQFMYTLFFKEYHNFS